MKQKSITPLNRVAAASWRNSVSPRKWAPLSSANLDTGYPPVTALKQMSRIGAGILLALFLSLSLIFPVLAQSSDAQVRFFLKAPEDKPLTVGDRITLRLEVTHPLDSQISVPRLDQTWGALEVVEQSQPDLADNNDGTATTGQDIIVTAFEPGRVQSPILVITQQKADGSTEELSAPIVQLTITSVLTDDTNLRDLKPQVDLPIPPIWPWLVAGLVAMMLLLGLLVGAALWFYDRYRRRVRPELAPALVVDTRSPEEIAYAELDRIETLNLPARHQIKEHFSLVDLCLRRYIEGRYQIPALEQTRFELQSAFHRAAVLAEDKAEFMAILGESDLVKFARYLPHADNVAGLIQRARTLVRITTPVPAVEKSTPPEAETVA